MDDIRQIEDATKAELEEVRLQLLYENRYVIFFH